MDDEDGMNYQESDEDEGSGSGEGYTSEEDYDDDDDDDGEDDDGSGDDESTDDESIGLFGAGADVVCGDVGKDRSFPPTEGRPNTEAGAPAEKVTYCSAARLGVPACASPPPHCAARAPRQCTRGRRQRFFVAQPCRCSALGLLTEHTGVGGVVVSGAAALAHLLRESRRARSAWPAPHTRYCCPPPPRTARRPASSSSFSPMLTDRPCRCPAANAWPAARRPGRYCGRRRGATTGAPAVALACCTISTVRAPCWPGRSSQWVTR